MLRRFRVVRGLVVFLGLAFLLGACSVLVPGPGSRSGTPAPTVTFLASPTPTLLFPTPRPTLQRPTTYEQAPELKRAAGAGELPPVEERLPLSPKVIRVTDTTGVYGGTWRMVIQPAADEEQFLRYVAYEPLIRWTPDWSGYETNLLESYSVNRNATEYTFHLRKGIRWSDGVEFTTEDIRFFYEDVLLNPDLMPIQPYWLKAGGQTATFTFPEDDRYTFIIKFTAPNTLFLARLASPETVIISAFPAHYIRKYHIKYASPQAIARLVDDGRYASWADMFISRVGVNALDNGNFVDPDRPRLSAWVLKSPYSTGVESVTWERNPYYWKVDLVGNQLPYIDRVVFTVVNNVDEVINQAVDGQIDMQILGSLRPNVVTALSGAGEQIGLFSLVDGTNNVMVIHLNQDTPNDTLRQVFSNVNFRIGLSYAINRQEIIDQVYGGVGQPWQPAPRRDSVFFDNSFATQYTEYDLDRANDYLDRAGFTRDVMGKRIGPDGLPISFVILVPENDPDQITMLNMIAQYWRDVGIEIHPKAESLPIFLAMVRSNLHDAAVSRGGATFFYDVILNPSNYLPFNENTFWGVRWANWYNTPINKRDARARPSQSIVNEMSTYDRIRVTGNAEAQRQFMNSVLTLAKINFWTMGIALGPDRYGIVQKNFHNVPLRMPSSSSFAEPGPANPEQFFIQP